MTDPLAGRVAIVTGASRGLGRSISLALAARGARVAIAARTAGRGDDTLEGSVDETAAAIRAAGGTALPIVADLTNGADLERLVTTTQQELGSISILVNNAAATVPGRPGQRPQTGGAALDRIPGVTDIPLKAVRKQFDLNLFTPWQLIQLVLPDMLTDGFGSIINIGSEAARMPGPPAAYGASKLALEHLTASVAKELTDTGVLITALLPSLPIMTPGVTWVGGARPAATDTEDDFAEAVVRLAAHQVPDVGTVAYSGDVLHPQLGVRGWQGGPPDGLG